MKLRTALTIRWHLLLLLLALSLPFLVFLLISATRQAEHDSELAAQQMLSLARLTAARLDDQIGDIRQILLVLSGVVSPTAEDVSKNDALLRGLASRLPPHISNLSVWTVSGVNAGTMDARLRAADPNVTQRKFFREALQQHDLAVEAPVTSVSTGKLVGVFALRIERNGKIVGVVAVSAQLEQLQNLLAQKNTLPKGGLITVTDESGVVLARSIDPEKWVGTNALATKGGLVTSLALREGTRNGSSADGIPRIAGFTMASRVPWLVYVGVPVDVALAPVRVRLHENIAAGAAMLAVGLLLAMWVAHRISAPLRQLGLDAALLERGNLGHRSTVARGGEIGALASTLNRMAEALQLHNTSLETSQVRLKQLAEHDHLTGLPNRALFVDRLGAAIARAQRSKSPLALLFLDIDHFKTVNDTLGHAAGDEVLRNFAQMLLATVRGSDTVARFAGDEFTIILEALGGPDDAQRIARTIIENAQHRVGEGAHTVAVASSIGIALFVEGDSVEGLIHRADGALYEAKRAGRNRYHCAAMS